MQTSQQPIGHPLKSDLARYCLPEVNRSGTRRLAWTNSICVFFLSVGIIGARTARVTIKPPPPLEEIIPAMVEPVAPPPPIKIEAHDEPETPLDNKPIAPQVVVTIDSPAINFAVPTVGSLVVPNSIAVAPPASPMTPILRPVSSIKSLSDTGIGGTRRQPPYPPMAKQLRQQGIVVLSMTADERGLITDIDVKESSGFSILDRSTLEFVKKHWILPAGNAGQVYEAPIHFILEK